MVQNKALELRFWNEIWNKGNTRVATEILPADYAEFELPWVALWYIAFPDFQVIVNELAHRAYGAHGQVHRD
jgi:hypothetical protein